MLKARNTSKVATIISQMLLGILFLIPLLWMVIASFKPEESIFAELCYLKGFSFTNFTIENYFLMFKRTNMLRYVLNSIIYILIVLCMGLTINSMAGYSLAKIKFPGRRFVISLIVALYIVPFETLLLPLYINCTKWGLVDNYWSLSIPFVADCFNIFLFRQFFSTLPNALIEAASIDGAGTAAIYAKIALPNAKPAFATAAVLTIVKHWGDFMWPLITIVNQDYRTVQLGITSYFADPPIKYGPIMAGLTFTTIPMLLIYIFMQKYYIQGIVSSGIKA